ncbi:F-box protein [Candidatus Arsenophonus triatominarum]|uniref:F-box protein n=1 Tax=Candidatus Arsenophonus triatominarum TaxID=57911 RepID=UPI00165075E4|nr:F-box protein [Candidatus Arsenophonus triatominarum]
MNNSSHRLVSYSDSESTSSNNQNSPLANVIGIKNLPPELIENIAFRLPENDYINFRQASKDFASTLESVKSMAEDYYNNDFSFTCKGQLSENKSKLVSNSYALYCCITKDASPQTLVSLANIKSEILNENGERLRISFSYPINTAPLKLFDSVDILYNFSTVQWNWTMDTNIELSIFMDKASTNHKSVTEIFNKADLLFTAKKTDSGLLIAAIISHFHNYISGINNEDGTRKFSDEVLASYRDSHRSMFLTGDCINRFTPR